MARDGIMSFLSVNRSLTNLGGEVRQFRLPRMNPFPKLDVTAVRRMQAPADAPVAAASPLRRSALGPVVIAGADEAMPEMATDMIDGSNGYAVENVKRERTLAPHAAGAGWTHLVGRVFGGRGTAGV
jgi:hypothetical protein